jgi:glucose-specific phosphotransferase system IIA component
VLNNALIKNAGGTLFENLPVLFAVAVAMGMAGGDGVAALAGLVGHLVLTAVLTQMNPNINMGVFSGIIVGVTAALLYRRYHDIKLPSYLGFFAGKRFVPIVTALAALVLGYIFGYIWPPIQVGINAASRAALNSGAAGPFFFGFGQRILIPFGLHHIFYQPFWFEFGQFRTATGAIVRGDIPRFFAGDPTAGRFTSGLFPFMLFGLPAAALAMVHEAKPERRRVVGGIMASAALTSFLTGITEPIEFAFAFVAPALFVIHSIFAGLSFVVLDFLGVRHGFTFSGGFIDYVLNWGLATRPILIIPVGLVFAVIYYFGFRWAIRKWNLPTPGREPDDAEAGTGAAAPAKDGGTRPAQILSALGGSENIEVLDACITRLRVTVRAKDEVNTKELKRLGAAGVLEVGNNLQAVFGTESDSLKEQIKDLMAGRQPAAPTQAGGKAAAPTQAGGKAAAPTQAGGKAPDVPACPVAVGVDVVAPMSGEIRPLSDVPDPVFAEKMMGDGFCVFPTSGRVVAPVSGKVITLFPTHHAIGLRTPDGLELLVHVGVDTVKLQGEGFKPLVAEGADVEAGQPLLDVDLEQIRKKVPSIATPVVFTNLEGREWRLLEKGSVVAGFVVASVDPPKA